MRPTPPSPCPARALRPALALAMLVSVGGLTASSTPEIRLPERERTFPEPLPPGRTSPGYGLRGIKGWMWRPEQYLAELPVLARARMNFLMNCYLSMFDIEHHKFGEPDCNRWWEPLPEEKKRAYEEVVRACAREGIQFCFCLNPNLTARRFANPDQPGDVDDLWQHYRWMQDLGVKWFSLCLDDINQGVDARMQARLVNEILRRLRGRDPGARMIFCPTYYSGDGSEPAAQAYLRTIAAELDADVLVFWTGDAVSPPVVTRAAAERFRALAGHRVILWDNYPVNDNFPTMNLGPLTGRGPELCEVLDGYMANSLCPQNEINRLPVLTCADYAYNPWQYDPARSIGQAIMHSARTDEQRQALAALVEAFPGNLNTGRGYAHNPLRGRFTSAARQADGSLAARAVVAEAEQLLARLQQAFPAQFADARRSVANDIAWMKAQLARPRGEAR